MLQNRVDPFGSIILTKARGTFMGNRGIVHGPAKTITRAFQIKAWLTCALSFKGRSLPVMEDHHNTQLFFYDEAVSFSAGHRPCACCRREDYNRFKTYWITANPEFAFNQKVRIQEIDSILHTQRINKKNEKIVHQSSADELVTGSFVAIGNKPYLVSGQLLYPWTPEGYGTAISVDAISYEVLTPVSIVRMFKAGYSPAMQTGSAV